MQKTNHLVSMIVLTHNSKNFLYDCVNSINDQDYDNFELIIVDNCSDDGTRQMLTEIKLSRSFPLKIILNSSNLGYNLGNLSGIDSAKGDFIAIINPDVILTKSWLSNIMNLMKNESEIIAVSGKFLDAKGKMQSTGGILDIYGATRQRKPDDAETNFFYNPGAAFVFRREVLSKIQLDPHLFMYYDDVDFAWQARLCGFKIGYCSDASAYHLKNNLQAALYPSKFYHIAKNRIYVCLKNYSLKNISRRIFKIIFFLFLDSVYYSFSLKSIRYFLSFNRAIFWNIFNIKKLKHQRHQIQESRINADEKIEEFMTKKSIEVEMLRWKI